MNKTPYLQVVDFPRNMGGKGAPQRTVFGVLGHTKESGLTRSLGGLVLTTTAGGSMPHTIKDTKKADNTEHHIGYPPSKTCIPGAHMGMVPFPGLYMSELGKSVS